MSSRSNMLISLVIIVVIFGGVGAMIYVAAPYEPSNIAIVVMAPGFGDMSKADTVEEGMDELALLRSSHDEYLSSYYCLSVLLHGALGTKRYEIVKGLQERGVGTSVYYPRPVPLMTYYREKYGYREGSFPEAERISNTSIALPVGPHLEIDDMEAIAAALKKVIAEVK